MASSDPFQRARTTFTEFVPRSHLPTNGEAGAVDASSARAEPVVDLRGQVKSQIEWYFGIPNLSKDFYLNSCMDSNNFMSIQSLAAFKRLRLLTQDLALIVEMMSSIPALEVNQEAMTVRPRTMPQSKEIRIKVEGHQPPPLPFFLDSPRNLENTALELFGRDSHVILFFKTEADTAAALAAIRAKAAAENRRVSALMRDPTVFIYNNSFPNMYGGAPFGMYPPQQMFFNPGPFPPMPYMYPGAHPGSFRPPQDRRNRPRSVAGSASGFRRDEVPAQPGLIPRHVTEGSVPLSELPHREFSPRRGFSDGFNVSAPPFIPGPHVPAPVPVHSFAHVPPHVPAPIPAPAPAPAVLAPSTSAAAPAHYRAPGSGHIPAQPPSAHPQSHPHSHSHSHSHSQPQSYSRSQSHPPREQHSRSHNQNSNTNTNSHSNPRRGHSSGDKEQRPRSRRHDGQQNHQSAPAPPPREPSPVLGAELFPPLAAAPARPTPVVSKAAAPSSATATPDSAVSTPAAAPTPAPPAAEEAVVAAVTKLSVSKEEEPSRASPDRPSFAEMLKRKAEAAKEA